MPPPPLGIVTKSRARSPEKPSSSGSIGGSSKSALRRSSLEGDPKGKSKEVVIEVDDDDDEITITGQQPRSTYKGQPFRVRMYHADPH